MNDPPAVPPPSLPFHVGRSRMHNLPLYRKVANGNRRITELRRIRGDIWVRRGRGGPGGGLGGAWRRWSTNRT